MAEVLSNWDTDYTGSAIYSLVDQNGKRYIGQASNLKRRLKTHHDELTKVSCGILVGIHEGIKLQNAIVNGMTFTVEVLKYIKWTEATINNLRYWEDYYLSLFGGIKNTYNTSPVASTNKTHEYFNSIFLLVKFTDKETIDFLNGLPDAESLIKQLLREHMGK